MQAELLKFFSQGKLSPEFVIILFSAISEDASVTDGQIKSNYDNAELLAKFIFMNSTIATSRKVHTTLGALLK